MKRNPYLNYTRLPMENAYNVRELGGYATKKRVDYNTSSVSPQ